MGEMISMIAHQWRQPISVIGMCANNMLLDIELENMDTKEFDKQLHDILFQTEHLSSTIDDFRNFFKPNKHKEYVSIKNILEDALKLLEKSFENHLITLSLRISSDTMVLIHKRELLQVFLNILKNAKEALEHNAGEQGLISIVLKENAQNVCIKICDNGGGISPEVMQHLFEPYFSTKSEKNGTGLGLYMSKTIVEKHLFGELKAYNHDDGACFEICLPKHPIEESQS
jgi:signal transduction histidine kinase